MILHYIHWAIDPVMLDLSFIQLRWYGVFFALGVGLAYLLANQQFRKANIAQTDFEKLSFQVILGAVIGARLGHCIFYDWAYFSQHPLEIILPFRFSPETQFVGFLGLASHGGAIGILIVLAIAHFRFPQISTWFVLDTLALGIPLTGCCIRLGNLMNSEMIGKASNSAWAWVFDTIDQIPRHPTQLYEALAYLLIFGVLNFYAQKFPQKPNGLLFAWFLILLFTARFFIEFFKENQVDFERDLWLNMGQILSIPFVLTGIVLLILKNKTKLNFSV